MTEICEYILALFTTTSGVQGQYMGSDEKEIIYIAFQAINVTENKLLDGHELVIRTEQNISQSLQLQIGLSEEDIRNGIPFQDAVNQISDYLGSLDGAVRVVTDGQAHIRQCLQPDAVRRESTLPILCNSFSDLRKEFSQMYPGIDIKNNSLSVMADHLSLEKDPQHGLGHCKTILNITIKLINQGHKLSQPETVNTKYIKGHCILPPNENESVVRLRGLPYQASDYEVARFFRGLNIIRGGVVLCLNPQNRRNGLAYIRFESQEHRDMALQRHRHHLGSRYIEVFTATVQEFVSHANSALINYYSSIVPNGADYILRLSGLPKDKDITEKDVAVMVAEHKINEENVLVLRNLDGSCTGEAFLFLFSENDAKLLAGMTITSTNITAQWSDRNEIQKCLVGLGYISPSLAPTVPPSHSATCLRDCVHIKGLSQNVTESDIIGFLSCYQSSVVWTHIHYNPKRKCSGSAFIQMCSTEEASRCSNECNQKFFPDCTGSRIVEVQPCSQDEMIASVRSSYFLTHSSYSVLIGSNTFQPKLLPHHHQMYLQPQVPHPSLFYYYPPATLPLPAGYGGAAGTLPQQLLRYRSTMSATPSSYLPDSTDYTALYNGVGHQTDGINTTDFLSNSIVTDFKQKTHAGYTQ